MTVPKNTRKGKHKPHKCRICRQWRVLDYDLVCWNCRVQAFDSAENWLTEHPMFTRNTRPTKAERHVNGRGRPRHTRKDQRLN
jgi:hypothetical protein